MVTLLVMLGTLTTQTTPVSTFCVTFHVFLVGDHGDFKFDMQVNHNMFQLMDDKPTLKGAWSFHVTIKNF